jgi:UDP-sulfoquinovose synthase
MRVLILGIDGYLGYPLALSLLSDGHEVCGIDAGYRRDQVRSVGGDSLTPIMTFSERADYISLYEDFIDEVYKVDITNYQITKALIKRLNPDTIVHLAEQPSGPFSMIDADKAVLTQSRNVLGTLALLWAIRECNPDIHLVKLGSMGEYGTPNCKIPEGTIPETCIASSGSQQYCPMEGLLFPRQPGSFYHLSKVHDTYNIKFCCDTWGLRSTDIMQGVVFGTMLDYDNTDDCDLTRFDYDEYFGTVINRFCVQALSNSPLTIYGKGEQTRGFLPLKDSIQCMKIAINNPPVEGEYRTFNQFSRIMTVNSLAELVSDEASKLGFRSNGFSIDNPRAELDKHIYLTHNSNLHSLGFNPTYNFRREVSNMLKSLIPYSGSILTSLFKPKTTWR